MQEQGLQLKPLPEIPDYGRNSIEVRGLTFSYESSVNSPVILRDMNLELPTGR